MEKVSQRRTLSHWTEEWQCETLISSPLVSESYGQERRLQKETVERVFHFIKYSFTYSKMY